MSHTPTPWELRKSFCNDRITAVSADASVTIATMGNWHAQFVEEQNANAGFIVRAVNNHAKLVAKLDKVATWLERNAEVKEAFIKTCRFESINEEERANAKNYRATAADIRKTIREAGEL